MSRMQGSELRVQLLGELSVIRAGAILRLPRSKRARALLAYLPRCPRPVRRERLSEMFRADPADPRAAVRWSLSRLRPLVDDTDHPRVVADRGTVTFDR